jgi:hypothetical protein
MDLKKIKWFAGIVIIITMCAVAFKNIEIKSVDEYKKEQQQLADSGVQKDKNGMAQIIFEDGDEVSESEVLDEIKDQIDESATVNNGDADEKNTTNNKTDSKADIEAESQDDKSDKDNLSKSETKKSDKDNLSKPKTKKTDNSKTKNTNKSKTKKTNKNQTNDSKRTDDSDNSNKANDSSDSSKTDKSGDIHVDDGKGGVINGTKDSGQNGNKQNDKKQNETKASETETSQKKYIECSIEVNCFELSDNPDAMLEKFRKFIPEDGVILTKTTVKVLEGTTVYDILNAACKKENIAIDASYNALYKAYYVRSINNLPERAAGDMSGWVYTVNGKSPMLGASAYKVADGDVIVWSYTVDGVPD